MTAPAPARTRTLHEMCEDLLTQHTPLATQVQDDVRSVVLRDPGGNYYLLSQNTTEGDRICHLFTWTGGRASATISPADDSRSVPAGAVSVIKNAVPIPQDGTLLGWVGPSRRFITALIPVYVRPEPDSPKPSWAVVPHADAPASEWPPFITGNLFCPKMWEAVQAGQLVSLGPVIADHEDTVFWVESRAADRPGYCLVDSDIHGDGFVLPAGKYADYDDLRRGMDWPEDLDLIVDYIQTDLASRFF